MTERTNSDDDDGAADCGDPEVADDENLTAAQVAREWNVSPRTIHRYIGRGKLRAKRLPGGGYRIRRSDVDEAMQQVAS